MAKFLLTILVVNQHFCKLSKWPIIAKTEKLEKKKKEKREKGEERGTPSLDRTHLGRPT